MTRCESLDELRARIADLEESVEHFEFLWEEEGVEYGDRLMEALDDLRQAEKELLERGGE